MVRRLWKPLLAIVPVALVALLAIVLISASSPRRATGPGCDNPSDSALNQYCDAIPAGTGAVTPRPGYPTLESQLPAQLLNHINHDGRLANDQRVALLSLPASGARHRLNHPSAQRASVASLSGPMIAVLAALAALLLLGVMVASLRRRRRASTRG